MNTHDRHDQEVECQNVTSILFTRTVLLLKKLSTLFPSFYNWPLMYSHIFVSYNALYSVLFNSRLPTAWWEMYCTSVWPIMAQS